jgi:Tfp pilus assembly protein PilX
MSARLSSAPAKKLQRQAGMVLLICLIFLTALTLLGLSASADAVLQKKLAANLQEAERARQAALSSLSWAEQWLLELDGLAPDSCTEPCNGLHIHTPGNLPPNPEFESLSWWLDHGHEAGIDPSSGNRITTVSAGSIDPAAWIIEAIHSNPPAEDGSTDLQVWYRILARGSGRTSAAVSVVEGILVRSWPSSDSTDLTDTSASNTCPGSGASAKCGRVSWRELR